MARRQQKEISSNLRIITPRTISQDEYVKTIQENEITFCVGPAGSGKTLLATYLAIKGLYDGAYEKVILTKPIVEADEQLGYLPGDILEKVDPHMRPLYDCIEKCIPRSIFKSYLLDGSIEVCPLAYLRGRTLERAFVIGDEFQNATYSQIKLFITRLGDYSKMVMTGDPKQLDIKSEKSGLLPIMDRLEGIHGVGISTLHNSDVQRNPVLKPILERL